MQFAIITALVAVLTLSVKYIQELMKETNYDHLIILKHSIYQSWYKVKLISITFRYTCIVTLSVLLLILSQTIFNNKGKNLGSYLTDFLIIVFAPIALYTILTYVNKKIKCNMHHSITLNSQIFNNYLFISLLISTVIIGAVYVLLLNYSEYTLKAGLASIMAIIIISLLVYYLLKEDNIEKNYKKELDGYTEWQTVDATSYIAIIIDDKESKIIDILHQNISIDINGMVWIFDRNNVQINDTCYKLSDTTILKIKDETGIINRNNYNDKIGIKSS